MDPTRQHRHQLAHFGEAFVVCSERAGSTIRVWIERGALPGPQWVTLADGRVVVPEGPNNRNEFAVLSDEQTAAGEEIAFSTGLFQRTGRSIRTLDRSFAIWNFSPASPLRIRTAGDLDSRVLHDPMGLERKDMAAITAHFRAALREFDVTGIVGTGPDVTTSDPDRRAQILAAPEDLHRLNPQVFASDRRRLHPASEWGMLADSPYAGSPLLLELGYKAWVSVRTALTEGDYFEILMLGPDSLAEGARPFMAAATALNMVLPLRRAAVAAMKISPRELEVLRVGPMGLRETASVLDVTESTVKFHRVNLRRKIGGETTWQTYMRAQKLGVFD